MQTFAKNHSREQDQYTPHYLVILHLLPGAITLLAYIAIAPLIIRSGFRPDFALMLSFLFVGMPFLLGVLFYQGRKRNGTFSLEGIVVYRNPRPYWQYLLIIPLFAYAIAISEVTSPVSLILSDTVFSGLPDWFLDPSTFQVDRLSMATLLTMFIGTLAIDGVANPIVEELYFRGFLLPRLSPFKAWAPLVHAGLFSVAHFWQPQNVLQIFLMVVPIYYLVWWRRNIYLSIIAHSLANLIGAVLAFGPFL